jgi:hypothetical protein
MITHCYRDADEGCRVPARGVDDGDCFCRGGHGAFGGAVVVGGGQLHRVIVCFEIGVGCTRSVFEFSWRWRLVWVGRARSDSEGRPRGCGGHSFLVLRLRFCLFSSEFGTFSFSFSLGGNGSRSGSLNLTTILFEPSKVSRWAANLRGSVTFAPACRNAEIAPIRLTLP